MFRVTVDGRVSAVSVLQRPCTMAWPPSQVWSNRRRVCRQHNPLAEFGTKFQKEVPLLPELPELLYNPVREVELEGSRLPPCQRQLDFIRLPAVARILTSYSRFDTIPACDRRNTDRHRAIA